MTTAKKPKRLENRIAINQSRVKAWRTCYRMHHYKYEEKLKKKKIKRPFMFGGIVHNMLEAYANADDPWDVLAEAEANNRKLFRAEKELYGDIVSDIKIIMTEYFAYWPERGKNALQYARIQGSAAEHIFEIELMDGVVWKGKIDALAKYNDIKALVEHKSFSKEWSEDDRWRNVQSCTYNRAARMMGWYDPEATVWDMIHSKPPTVPQLLKSGKLSTRKIVTLPSALDQAFKEYKLSPKKYPILVDMAHKGREHYFQRILTPISEETEEAVFSDFVETAHEIVDFHDKRKTRNIGRHCGWCDFEPLCRASLQGLDYDYVKEKEYEEDLSQDYARETTGTE